MALEVALGLGRDVELFHVALHTKLHEAFNGLEWPYIPS